MRMGFTGSLFHNRNESDILAAMRVWAGTLTAERKIRLDPNMTIYPSVEAAATAVRQDRVDALAMLLEEYGTLPSGLLEGPFLLIEGNGRTHTEFVLLTRKADPINGLRDLDGARIVIHDDPFNELGLCWLNAQLAAAGMDRLDVVAKQVEKQSKLSSTVLGLFFGKFDACLLRNTGFETMVELNPQVGRQLGVVAKSAPVIGSLFCTRKTYNPTTKRGVFRQIILMDQSVAGKQVLGMFKSDRMIEVPAERVEESLSLLGKWRRAAEGTSGDLRADGGAIR